GGEGVERAVVRLPRLVRLGGHSRRDGGVADLRGADDTRRCVLTLAFSVLEHDRGAGEGIVQGAQPLDYHGWETTFVTPEGPMGRLVRGDEGEPAEQAVVPVVGPRRVLAQGRRRRAAQEVDADVLDGDQP